MSNDLPQYVTLPDPVWGNKIWLMEEKGTYVLESGPTCLIGAACTHAGSGGVSFIDGTPDKAGYFPGDTMPRYLPDGTPDPNWFARNGRPVFRNTAAVMGMWMMNGGLYHGLTVKHSGQSEASHTMMTITWSRYKGNAANPVAQPEPPAEAQKKKKNSMTS